jgi:hypothetical protein
MASIEVFETAALPGRWLITAATLAYGVGPFVIDLNRTHLLHPAWPGHARFHLVWSVLGQFLVSGIALWLIWSDGPGLRWRCHLAILIGACFVSAFFGAWATAAWYRGTLHDPGGIKPVFGVDGNVIACGLMLAALVVAWILL